MRFFMIAAALCVAALTTTGCAITGDGCGCMPGASMGGCSSDCGCDAPDQCNSGCQSSGESLEQNFSDSSACGCGGSGCQGCGDSNKMSGLYSDKLGPGPEFGGGMAMPLFARGAACGDGCGRFGCGRLGLCLGCRARGRAGRLVSDDCGCEETVVESPGLFARLKAANEAAVATQEAAFVDSSGGTRVAALGCGPGGCDLGAKARGALQYWQGNPYGGAVPHTTQPNAGPGGVGPGGAGGMGGAGAAPTYAYPYYTTRGPRDFLDPNPASIGY